MILSSPIYDRYFHECFSQPIVSKPEISSCSVTNFADISNICLSVRSAVFTMEFWLFWKIFPMSAADSIVTAINILQIIECFFSISCNVGNSFLSLPHLIFHPDSRMILILQTIPILFFRFPWWNFQVLPLWELILCFSVPYGLRGSVEKNFFWWGRTLLTILQEVFSGRPDRSYVLISVFHSWEDQTRSSSDFE